jgi:hypothetical protein
MLSLLVKGNRFEAAKAASARNIPFVFVREHYPQGLPRDCIETFGHVSREHWDKVSQWFHGSDTETAPYAPGTLLHFGTISKERSATLHAQAAPQFFATLPAGYEARDMILTATRLYPSRKWELRFSDALYSVATLCGGKETPRFRTRRDACAFALANGGNAATFREARFRSEGAIGRKYHGAEIATSLRVYARDVAA